MEKSKPLIIFLPILLVLFLSINNTNLVFSQNQLPNSLSNISQDVNQDENLQAKDLGIKEPKILPDNPLYFFKNLGRKIQYFFTFNPTKKANLELKFASEKLVEAKKLIKKGKTKSALKALESQEKNFETAKKIIEKNKKSKNVENLLTEMADKTIKHQKVLDNLEKNVNLKDLPKIRKIKENLLKTYILSDDAEKVPERIQKILTKQKGSEFKELKSLQVLNRVKEIVPENAKRAIDIAIENQIKKIQAKLNKLPEEKKEKIKDYLLKLGGDKISILESLKDIEQKENLDQKTKENLKKARKEIINKLRERLEKSPELENLILNKLKKPDIKKLEILKDLEENSSLNSKLLTKILNTKKQAIENLIENFKTKSPDKKEKIIKNLLKYHPLKALIILKSEKQVLSKQKQKELDEIENKINSYISNKIEKLSKNPQELEKKLNSIISDNPNEIREIENLKIPPTIKKKLRNKLQQKLLKRLKSMKNVEEIKKIKNEIKNLGISSEKLNEIINNKLSNIKQKITANNVKNKIKKAKELLSDLNKKIKETKLNNISLKGILTLKNLAEKEIKLSENNLENKKIGAAYGNITSAISHLKSAIKILTKLEWLKSQKKSGIVCPEVWQPVCGKDGKTYSNECFAKAANVEIAHQGICKKLKPSENKKPIIINPEAKKPKISPQKIIKPPKKK